MIGLTVVGNAAATVITSSPGLSRCSPRLGEVKAVTAQRFAEEPEFTREALRIPINFAKSLSNCSLKRPDVSQKSSEASTASFSSSASKTFPETGTGEEAGTNALFGKAER